MFSKHRDIHTVNIRRGHSISESYTIIQLVVRITNSLCGRYHSVAFLPLFGVCFWFLLHNSDNDSMLKTVCWTASVSVNYVWTLFETYL